MEKLKIVKEMILQNERNWGKILFKSVEHYLDEGYTVKKIQKILLQEHNIKINYDHFRDLKKRYYKNNTKQIEPSILKNKENEKVLTAKEIREMEIDAEVQLLHDNIYKKKEIPNQLNFK